MAKKISWKYKCAICGATFPIWWVSSAEWKAGGFKKKHVCKKCFETKVQNPYYYSIEEYIENTIDFDDTAEIIQKRFPAMTPEKFAAP
jgi:hypothetical protein